ncbi:glycoside hydrolase family 16 protein [Abyssalbus ytuae]|uniref:Glycoside hydrolase family 16 protein n=1 Tax=Abyssalbus ytuae TaxID=2926907 RepID=A0A9E6ZL61_9FLAO|nr:glycoside hydrolase family 16 protein [Abyssalbus ytuae]UOB16624.1 glycoside hydrolase family 16 protein [Abyssalbus ytuae]
MLLKSILLIVCGLLLQSCGSYHYQSGIPKKVKGYQLVWNDEFNIDGKPDPENWTYESGFVRNNELQWYQTDNAVCKDGHLVISANKVHRANPNYIEGSDSWKTNRAFVEYTSSCIITRGLQEWENEGYYEIKAKVDTSSGSWPAIWLLGTYGGWPDNGEIDIMEFYRIDEKPHILANAAWGTDKKWVAAWDSAKIPLAHFTQKDPKWTEKFHIWAMEWNSTEIKIYLDDELLNEIDLTETVNTDGRNPFVNKQKFYLLLNLAIGALGGEPDVDSFPLKYEVDYVRVYK